MYLIYMYEGWELIGSDGMRVASPICENRALC